MKGGPEAIAAERDVTHDAFGRVVSVVEHNGGSTYTTTYGHTVLDLLTSVTQGGQARNFTYDSLGRLVTATNPESGAVSYGYDGNGNLISRTDALGVVTSIQYDGLNRPLQKSFTGGTPQVDYQYDVDKTIAGAAGESKAIGRLVRVANSANATEYRYDGLGRALASKQTTAGLADQVFLYTHKPAGLASMTYPSGRVVNQEWNEAGQVSALLPGTGLAYASSIKYSPFGGIQELTLGNGLVEKWLYSDKRGQVRRIALGTTGNETSGGEWQFSYCAPGTHLTECTTNNGNPRSQMINPLGVTQDYTFDGLNRVKTIVEPSLRQTFVYDRWGNRALLSGTANGNYVPAWPPAPVVTSDDETLAAQQFAANRCTAATPDAAGNLLRPKSDAYPHLEYDGENRVKLATTGVSSTVVFEYDGEGRRVKKTSGGVTTYFVYDALGRLAAEYGPVSAEGGLHAVWGWAAGRGRGSDGGAEVRGRGGYRGVEAEVYRAGEGCRNGPRLLWSQVYVGGAGQVYES